MLRRGGEDNNNHGTDDDDKKTSTICTLPRVQTTTTTPSTKLRGLLKLLKGQICNPNSTHSTSSTPNDTVSVYSYEEDTLLETHKEFQKRRKRSELLLQHSSSPSLSSFEEVICRHRFVCFFVIQGRSRRRGRGRKKSTTSSSSYYCTHTLNLRKVIAAEYHDVMSTFVIDIGSTFSSNNNSNSNSNSNVDTCVSVDYNKDPLLPLAGDGDDKEDGHRQNNNGEVLYGDEETIINDRHEEEEEDLSCSSNNNNFCSGTGFTVFPSTVSISTILAILNVSKIPSVVVIDTTTGRIVSRDAILAIEKNNSHTVINRWQSGKSGLSFSQSICAAVTCQSEDFSCCTIQ
jgi:hypothetical protein